ncbi:MAG: RNA methyltransferase [Bacteroidota bacterium]|nr:RNA methyltransferase [Bacteroidota bacterium]
MATDITELPIGFINRMKQQLGAESNDFFDALLRPSPTSIRLNHNKGLSDFTDLIKVPWCEEGYYLPARPPFYLDPHWHGGAYYVQEASSMILDYILQNLKLDDQPRIWLDMCAAPGGKTGILVKHIKSCDILIANEVIPQRKSILRENLIKGGYLNTFISSEPSSNFRTSLADIILVDAPCAGEGMMRKEPEAIRQWSENLVNDCSILQAKILDDALTGLKDNGYLIYSTCSYSEQENIDNVVNAIEQFPVSSVEIQFPEEWKISRIEKQGAIGYQLYPHRVKGEGLFIAILKKEKIDIETEFERRFKKEATFFTQMPEWLSDFMSPLNFMVLKNVDSIRFINREAEEKATKVLQQIPRAELITEAGILKSKDFIPNHFLSMSQVYSSSYGNVNLDLSTALDYLERSANSLPSQTLTGWTLMSYKGTILGWAKNTSQGWKNYYPLHWRLRSRHS